MGVHSLVLTPTLQASGGTLDNEPNTSPMRDPLPAPERSLSVPTPIDDLVKTKATHPKGPTAAADHVGSAEQPPKERSRQQTLKYSLPPSVKKINTWMIAAAIYSLVGLTHGARGARFASGPDPPTWDPDSPIAMPRRTWVQQLMVWGIIAADLDSSRQRVAIIG